MIEFFKLISIQLVFFILAVAYYTLCERKIRSIIQRRWGPDVVGLFGVLQPIADALKLLFKERKKSNKVNNFLYLISPIIGLSASFSSLMLISFSYNTAVVGNLNYSRLIRLIIRAIGTYSIIIGAWSSNSKYSVLGAVRAITQRLAYEIFFIFALIFIFRITNNLSISGIVLFQKNTAPLIFRLPFIFISFFISTVIETNRIPFDLSEAEAELVAGYNVEYGNVFFLMYFLAEYVNMFVVSIINILLFWGGYNGCPKRSIVFNYIRFVLECIILAQILILRRALLPRYRYDKMRILGWKTVLPFLLLIFPLTRLLTKYFRI